MMDKLTIKILHEISYSFPFEYRIVKTIYEETRSFDETIIILKGAILIGKSPFDYFNFLKRTKQNNLYEKDKNQIIQKG